MILTKSSKKPAINLEEYFTQDLEALTNKYNFNLISEIPLSSNDSGLENNYKWEKNSPLPKPGKLNSKHKSVASKLKLFSIAQVQYFSLLLKRQINSESPEENKDKIYLIKQINTYLKIILELVLSYQILSF